MDRTIYNLTYTYRSKLGKLPANMRANAIIEGRHNVQIAIDRLAGWGVTNVYVESFRAPDFGETMDGLTRQLNDYPVVSSDPV